MWCQCQTPYCRVLGREVGDEYERVEEGAWGVGSASCAMGKALVRETETRTERGCPRSCLGYELLYFALIKIRWNNKQEKVDNTNLYKWGPSIVADILCQVNS